MNLRPTHGGTLGGLAVLLLCAGSAQAAETLRYALVVGHNQGHAYRQPLKYAEREAAELASTLQEVGDVTPERTVLLQAPTRQAVLEGLDHLEALATRERRESGQPTVLIAYFSGHADGKQLELGAESLGFAELRERLEKFDSTVRVGVVDACMSGALMRSKGGRPGPSYHVNLSDRLRAEGLAFIASSGADELSQEADDIGGSYFSRAMVSGLRGAADKDSDHRVTLAELYNFVRDQTLRRSVQTIIGAQHPAYELRMKGDTHLVMARLPDGGAYLRLSEELSGEFVFWRKPDGHVLGEVNKEPGRSVRVLVPAGGVVVAMRDGRRLRGGELEVAAGEQKDVDTHWLDDQALVMTTSRGRPIRAEALALWAQYQLSAAVMRNALFLQEGALTARYDFDRIALFAKLGYGRTRVDDDGLLYDYDSVQGELWTGYVWQVLESNLVAGGGLGVGWYRQSLDRGDVFEGIYFSPKLGLRFELTAFHPASLLLGWDMTVNILRVDDRIDARWVPAASIGMGYRFE